MSKTRLQNLQKLLTKKKIPAFLIVNHFNIRYISGFTGTNGALLVTPKKHLLITDARYFMTAQKVGVPYYDQKKGLKRLMGKFKSIAFEDDSITVARLKNYKKELPRVKWKATSGLVESLRMIKDEAEIKIIKKAVQIHLQALRQFPKLLKPGVTEDQLEWELLKLVRELGAEGFSFPPIITFGKDTADIHHQKKATNNLKKGEMVLLDSGIIYQGYITDITRVFLYNKGNGFEQKIYSIVKKANQKAIQAIGVGKTFAEVDKAAREVIEKAGYGAYFPHSTGHGTGLEVHEAPTVNQKSHTKIKPGMVFTIEPGIYVEGKGGVRLEDMVYMNEKGRVEVLTQ